MATPFRTLAATIVPEAAALDEGGWKEFEQIVDDGLASRPQSIRRQIRLFIAALNLLPLFRFGRTFTALDFAKRTGFLEAIQNAPLLLIRRGFWGVRTLVFMGYYGRDAARHAIGYRADVRGWDARPGHPERSRGIWAEGGAPARPPGPSTTLGMTRR